VWKNSVRFKNKDLDTVYSSSFCLQSSEFSKFVTDIFLSFRKVSHADDTYYP
jgi:hypothetical protein